MGTNYYLQKPLHNYCKHCGRHDEPQRIHLGKSSAGWCFSLHVYPDGDEGIEPFSDYDGLRTWLVQEVVHGGKIFDEYNQRVCISDFCKIVTKREASKNWDSDWWAPKPFGTTLDGKPFILPGYTSEDEFHRVNQSERGPNGLLRHRVDGTFCIANGSGTWDCMVGDFS